MSMEEVFGEVLSSYSRAQAIADGVLVNLNDPSFTFRPGLNICAEAGIKFPVAMTIAAFAKTVSELDTPLPPCQDIPAGCGMCSRCSNGRPSVEVRRFAFP